jgi:hypothetical protein
MSPWPCLGLSPKRSRFLLKMVHHYLLRRASALIWDPAVLVVDINSQMLEEER